MIEYSKMCIRVTHFLSSALRIEGKNFSPLRFLVMHLNSQGKLLNEVSRDLYVKLSVYISLSLGHKAPRKGIYRLSV